MLILSGSNVSFMEEILNNRNDPLYQRATFQIHLEKMPFHEAKTFVEDRTIEEQVQYLGLFGPHPFYLGMIDRSISFQDNVRQLLYSKYGTLLDVPEKIMPVGVSEQNMYNSILQAVALGKRFSKEIAEAVGVENNYVAKYLSSLVQMQVLERRESFIRNRKTNYYAVADSLLRFWYRFIFDQRDVIQNGFGEVLFWENLDGIRDFTARSFEELKIPGSAALLSWMAWRRGSENRIITCWPWNASTERRRSVWLCLITCVKDFPFSLNMM